MPGVAAASATSQDPNLHQLVKAGSLIEIVNFVKGKRKEDPEFDIDSLNEDGYSSLHVASDLGHADIVDWLLQEGAADPWLCTDKANNER